MSLRACLPLLIVIASWAPVSLSAAEPLFAREVVPTLHKLGCSAGTCHGAFAGKGGFRLSLFAADPDADYQQIRGLLGRRLNLRTPEESLLLLKPTGRLPHGGDVRLKAGSSEYHLLRRWIEAGAPYNPSAEGRVLSVRIEPPMTTVQVDAAPASVRVLAKLESGSEQDVTAFTRFEIHDPSIASPDELGRITGHRSGDTSLLAHYAGRIGSALILVPRPHQASGGRKPPELGHSGGLRHPLAGAVGPSEDIVDQLILDKLKRLAIIPSPPARDTDFLRRLSLDVIGQLPQPEEIRKFLADQSPDKRTRKIDELLHHPLHAAVWATKLCDITGMDNRVLYDRAVSNAFDWYRNKLEANLPWDKLVEQVLTATVADERSDDELAKEVQRIAEDRKKFGDAGGLPDPKTPWRSGYALRKSLDVFFDNIKFRIQAGPEKGRVDPQPIALHAATAFLGVRLECAECHKHPHERWTQQDFLGFTAAFSYLGRSVDPALRLKKINLVGIYVADRPLQVYKDPVTGEPIGPRLLGGSPMAMTAGLDPRREVWKWMVAPGNPYFARAIVNRVWAHYFGRGLIDPVDSLSDAHPPSHPEVLQELERDFVAHAYDLRHLHRRILHLAAYARGWETNPTNADDERNLSHRVLQRMSAEQVLDAVAQVTQTAVQLAPVYSGDPNRKPERSIEYPLSRPGGPDSYVLRIFDKPQRTQSCDCERSAAPNLSQALYFYNDQALLEKISHPDGRLSRLLKEIPDDDRLLEELTLLTLSRLPSEQERQRARNHRKASKSRTEAFEDLLWSLLNRREFLITH